MQSNLTPRVFYEVAVIRLCRQNRLLRELRGMGCSVIGAKLDSDLTLEVAPAAGQILRRSAAHGGILMQRIDADRHLASVSLRGCRVQWVEFAR
jgi:hypothetical protein